MRNPKIILDRLTRQNQKREQECWQNTDLSSLRDRGTETGLTTYLQESKQQLSLVCLKQ